MSKYNLRLGYSSICNKLRDLGIFSSRGMIRNTINKPDGLENVKKIALQNIQDLQKIIIWNETQGIRLFRMTSQLFPHLDDSETPKYSIDFALQSLKETGKLARSFGHRITMHPAPT
jgi:UV DNA damage endonuclease